jgi:DNA repair photolyase
MKRWGKLKPVHFDEKELNTDLGKGNFIFVGSSCDMFANNIPDEWIKKTLEYCSKFNNKYLFQTKNPERVLKYYLPKSVLCTTIESDSFYPGIMGNSPQPMQRSLIMQRLSEFIGTYVTIEPIIDFHLEHLVRMIKRCNPIQVNIGADSGHNNLPEPSREQILELISELEKFTIVNKKKNLNRLLKA